MLEVEGVVVLGVEGVVVLAVVVHWSSFFLAVWGRMDPIRFLVFLSHGVGIEECSTYRFVFHHNGSSSKNTVPRRKMIVPRQIIIVPRHKIARESSSRKTQRAKKRNGFSSQNGLSVLVP